MRVLSTLKFGFAAALAAFSGLVFGSAPARADVVVTEKECAALYWVFSGGGTDPAYLAMHKKAEPYTSWNEAAKSYHYMTKDEATAEDKRLAVFIVNRPENGTRGSDGYVEPSEAMMQRYLVCASTYLIAPPEGYLSARFGDSRAEFNDWFQKHKELAAARAREAEARRTAGTEQYSQADRELMARIDPKLSECSSRWDSATGGGTHSTEAVGMQSGKAMCEFHRDQGRKYAQSTNLRDRYYRYRFPWE